MIEVLIFITLISLIFIAMSYLSVASIRSAKSNQYKIMATHYAEELREWLRGEKEVDWTIFDDYAAYPTGISYCMNTIPASIASMPSSGTCGNSYALDNVFKRDLTLTANSDSSRIDAFITVSWREGTNSFQVPVAASFAVWE